MTIVVTSPTTAHSSASWEGKHKGRPLVRRTADPYPAAVAVDDTLGRCQPDSDAIKLIFVMQSLKYIE